MFWAGESLFAKYHCGVLPGTLKTVRMFCEWNALKEYFIGDT